MLLRYHPERFRQSRPYAKQVINYFRNNNLSGLLTMDDFQDMCGIVINKYNEALQPIPLENRPCDSRNITKEVSYAVHYASFVMRGRNIFHFEPDIIASFRQTDIDEVPISALNFPYDSFYMSFGIQKDLDLWNEGYYVDGAYISMHPGAPLQITLSTVRTDVDYKDPSYWITSPDRYYYMPIEIGNLDAHISEEIDAALQKEIISHDSSHLPDESGVHDINGQYIELTDNKHNSSKIEIKEITEGFNVFREALRLVVNGLCYITSYQDDIEAKWPEDTPKTLLEKLDRATKASNYKKIKGELLSMGYSKVNYCGFSFRKNKVTVVEGRGDVASHWRRGHWRNQACGHMLKERKLIWIAPVLVRKDKGEPEQGHIYNV